MTALFADTFYWVALTNVRDSAHAQAKSFSRSLSPDSIVTTEPILIEYLNYFAAWGREFRIMASTNARGLAARGKCLSWGQSALFRGRMLV